MNEKLNINITLTQEQLEDAITNYCIEQGLVPENGCWAFSSSDLKTHCPSVIFSRVDETSPSDHEHDTVIDNSIPLCKQSDPPPPLFETSSSVKDMSTDTINDTLIELYKLLVKSEDQDEREDAMLKIVELENERDARQ